MANPRRRTHCIDCGSPELGWSKADSGSMQSRCHDCYNAYYREKYRARNAPHLVGLPGRRTAKPGSRPSGSAWYKLRDQIWAEESMCGICGEWVDKSLPARSRMGPTMDHIVPVAMGGSNDRANVRLAHLSCNASAGNRARETAANERVAFARAGLWIGDRLGLAG